MLTRASPSLNCHASRSNGSRSIAASARDFGVSSDIAEWREEQREEDKEREEDERGEGTAEKRRECNAKVYYNSRLAE